MAGSERTIVWFRRDLRIDDNPALATAAREGSVLPVFIWCPVEYGQYYPGRCSRWWLKQSLAHLGKSLESLGCPLVLIRAKESTLAALLKCVHLIGATRVVYNRLYGIENVRSCTIDDLGLESSKDEESSNALLSRAWSPGWRIAEKMLEEFVSSGLLQYSKHGMKVGGTTTSLLSPYLHFGKSEAKESIPLFLRAIGFREYSRYLCFNFPFTHERSLLGNLKHYPWIMDEDRFKSWRQGMTGYPLVDAGMRELWATGWTHNRIRVIVSSFAVKFLQIPWIWGMKYFWDVLLDADLESDILGWQYISGSLPDGHELSRLDNPEVQGQKYDPDGEYVRTWIPELARMPTEWIHRPWDAPRSILEVAGVELGFNYPKPIVELHTARECLDDAICMMWQLDTAAKLAELNGEVVEDNMNCIKGSNIPVVVLKKELSSTVSSFRQRLPNGNGTNKLQPTEVKGPYKQIIQADVMNASNVEDTESTANLQVSRKRSHRYLEQKADRNGAGKFEDDASVDSGTSTSRPSKRVA
ncbi:hypothetical protein PR202_ga16756 [Eleusine coracana subsp. coracana]|uniref:Photolyase/cryptochrome alpha/beta domain-containing protein n=1 Tax=Eleusine coracana subsp. coracana TaxID=191504 RepID=A0AAV5CNA5_ELECO|nr:hypothetical protein PR202_ga16756 [Eleusine coracana subsp. coracana]